MKVTDSYAEPEQILDEQIAGMATAGQAERCFALRFTCDQYYLPEAPAQPLVALVALSQHDASAPRIEAAILPYHTELAHELEQLVGQRASLRAFAAAHRAAWIDLAAPMTLAPVQVRKPWGKEIWHTGVEARGQASVSAEGLEIPLPWLLSLAPRRLAGGRPRDLILLKELHPHPQPVFGDLYFEVHRRKREAYIVTHLDARAWPDGVGGVRYGFNAEQQARYGDERAFKRAYLQAVQAYESVRREIDVKLDQRRHQAGLSATEPLPVETLLDWQGHLPDELRATERRLRAAMERFIAVRPVRVGDVVTVPPLTPHGLLHGVGVVEFQTADYERQILSFSQKVLTQSQWDTAEVLDEIPLTIAKPGCADSWSPALGISVECAVKFPDFLVLRVVLASGASLAWEQVLAQMSRAQQVSEIEPRYMLLMGLQGDLQWQGPRASSLSPGKARLFASCCVNGRVYNAGAADATLLLAAPRG